MMKIAWFGFSCVALLACNSVAVDNGNPSGAVGGIVLDAASEMPLAGATVKVTTPYGVKTGMSGMDGTFVVQGVAAGVIIIEISSTGYVTARFTDKLSGAIGNFPVNNTTDNLGVLGLIKNTGVFNVRIVDEKGGPAPAIKAIAHTNAQFIDFSSGSPVSRGSIEIPGTSDMNGLVVLQGLPDYGSLAGTIDDRVDVSVPPTKVMGQEAYSFLGITQSFFVNRLGDQSPTIILAGPHTPLAVLQSNLPYLRPNNFGFLWQSPTVPATGPAEVQFNQAIDPKTVRAQFLTDDAVTLANVQPSIQVLGNILELTPQSPLTAATRYHALIHTQSLNAGAVPDTNAQFDTVTPFFVAQAPGVSPAIQMTNPAPSKVIDAAGNMIVTFSFNEPVGLGNGSGGGVSCVAFYEFNLDNGLPAASPGEYEPPSPVNCLNTPGLNNPYIDITAIRPLETAGTTVTGFATRWQVTVNTTQQAAFMNNGGGCTNMDPSGTCTGPLTGTKAHLVFNRLPPGSTIRRLTGEPLAEDPKLTFVIP